jgi:SecD/SecF fusion protein
MPSYVALLIPLVLLVALRLLGRYRAGRQGILNSKWTTAAVLACLLAGAAIAITGWPAPLIAQENAAGQVAQQADDSRQETGEIGQAGRAQPVPEEKQEKQEEDEAEQTGTQPGGAQIESRFRGGVFNLILLIIALAVLIGPWMWGRRLTRGWREPLWGWPIGLVLSGGAAAAAVFLVRWVLDLLPVAYGDTFERHLAAVAGLQNLWIAVGLIAVPVWLGAYLSRKWRMPDHATKIGVVFFCVFAGLVITIAGWPPKLGIDLRGGWILIYKFEGQPSGERPDEENPQEDDENRKSDGDDSTQPRHFDMDKLVQAIRRRIDPGGVLELSIRKKGEGQIEVMIPQPSKDEEVARAEVERIKRKISSAGTLEFRILANNRDHAEYFAPAREKPPGGKLVDGEGKVLAWWVPVALGQEENFMYFMFLGPQEGAAPPTYDYDEESRKGVFHGIERPEEDREVCIRKNTDERGHEYLEVLVVKDQFNVDGSYLARAARGVDESAQPCVLFTFNHWGGQLFGGLTANNQPETGQTAFTRKLGIILDGYLQSAPAIKDIIFAEGRITGDYTAQKADDLVDILNAGSLPTTLSERPISEMHSGPTLGRDTVQRGQIAMVVSMGLVLLFMWVYYRFAGFVACMALLLNLVMILAVMISIKAAFTLPGLAGLVLTVGMAVDANVLIFERIREELARQATIRMAIRNGFDRATTTIVDANLTTLITASVLYWIGTDQIKGFAIVLWVGVVLSMFTAIYCSRVVFDVAEKQKWISNLKMRRILGESRIDFLGMRRVAIGASLLLIAVGLVAVGVRGSGLLDIDFTGGVSVEAVFQEPKPGRIAEIRNKLGDKGEGLQDLAVMGIQTLDNPVQGLRFMVNTSGPRDVDPDAEPEEILAQVEQHIQNAFGAELAHYRMDFNILSAAAGVSQTGSQPGQPDPNKTSGRTLPADTLLASADPSAVVLAQAALTAEAPASAETPSSDTEAAAPSTPPPVKQPAPSAKAPASGAAEQPAPAGPETPVVQTHAKLEFEHAVDYPTLEEMLRGEIEREEKAGRLPQGTVRFELFNADYLAGDVDASYKEWEVRLNLPRDQAEALLQGIEQDLESQPVFPSSNTIGGQVARGTRVVAILALLASLLGIIAYIWIRFQRVMFGLAAVLALVHDVLITLGVIALSAYLAPFLGFLGIDEFKIGLSVVAAFLTIIGYSLNDTIVVFDRIREVRGKAPQLTHEMINNSINQTLSRTLLTSLTTLIVVMVLYVGGGQAIHVFAFSLVVGVLVGTYSSIFVASPALFWMARTVASRQKGRPSRRFA